MTTHHPRFRTDLVAQPLELDGARFIDVTDPDSEETFRFYEVEYSVACAMDGQRAVPELVQWAKAELGLEPSAAEVETVIRTLRDLGYLAAAAAADDGLELGSAGPSSPVLAPSPAGGSDSLELGGAGASSIGEPRASTEPADPVELGDAGASARHGAARGGLPDPSLGSLDQELGPAGEVEPPAITMEADEPSGSLDGLPPPPEPPIGAPPPIPTLRRSTEPDSDEDGPTQLPTPMPDSGEEDSDVSVDLSDHLELDADDVKEAVRQSKVMQAVEMPADLMDDLDGKSAAPPVPAVEPEPKAEHEPERKPERKPEPEPEPEPKPKLATPAPAPEPGGGSSAGLILLLVLLLAVGGAAAYYLLVVQNSDNSDAEPAPAPVKADNKPEKPKPSPRTAKLAEAPPEVTEVTATAAKKVTWLIEDGATVEEGDVVAKLRGHESIERVLKVDRIKLTKYEAQRDGAKESGDARKEADRQHDVDRKVKAIADGEEALAPLLVRSNAPGTVKLLIESGITAEEGSPIAEIIGAPKLLATFRTQGKSYQPDSECQLVAKSHNEPVPCVVDSVEGDQVTVRLSSDVGLAAGEQVELK